VELELAPDLSFVVSVLEDGLEELDDEDDGAVLEPEPAEPLMLEELEPDGAELEPDDGAALDEDEEPLGALSLLMSIEVDEELEPEGAVLGVLAVPPAEDEDEPDGAVLEPLAGDVVDELDDERSAARSHAVISDAPSARETATAIVESLMWPPWLGYCVKEQGSGRVC